MVMIDVRNLLAIAAGYRLFLGFLGTRFHEVYIRDYVRPERGERVLDIGCGPGEIMVFLPSVDYLGIDINPRYVEAATERFGACGQFRCEDVQDTVVREPGSYDIV